MALNHLEAMGFPEFEKNQSKIGQLQKVFVWLIQLDGFDSRYRCILYIYIFIHGIYRLLLGSLAYNMYTVHFEMLSQAALHNIEAS